MYTTQYETFGKVNHFDFLKSLSRRLYNERKAIHLVFKHKKTL